MQKIEEILRKRGIGTGNPAPASWGHQARGPEPSDDMQEIEEILRKRGM
jgi:hypothetical protein